MNFILKTLVILCLGFVGAQAETEEASKESQQRWGGLPAYSYRAETGHQFGGLLVYYLPQAEGTSKPSDITSAILLSTKNQFRAVSSSSIFWNKDTKHYVGTLDFQVWPNQFYGIGEEPQFKTIEDFEGNEENGILHHTNLFTFDNLYEFSPDGLFWIGFENQFTYEQINWTKQGLLEQEGLNTMTGYNGGILSGLGVQLALDARDNINSAHKGYFAAWNSTAYGKYLGSDFNFHEHRLDLRYYLPLPGERTIALRTRQWVQFGEVPFHNLARTNGTNELRGVPIGTYQDKQLSSYQLEYRGTPLPWRLGYRIFTDIAQVRSNFNQWSKARYQKTYGLGVRWALNPEQKFNVRIELPIVDGALSPVIEIKEAF